MSVRQGNKTIAGHTGCHFDLFDHKWADHILNDPSWLRADTFSWQDGGVYKAAYNHLEADITGKGLQSETIAGITIQFYLADDKHKICPANQENNVSAIYAATGVAWYYILDTANKRFKLPRTKYGFTGLRNGVGNYVPESLPNIKGNVNGVSNRSFYSTPTADGAFYVDNYGNNAFAGGGGIGSNSALLHLDASRSSAAYQDGAPVQPPATQMYLYFYVGNFTQSALENTAGLNAELFNGKADVSTVAHVVTEYQAPTADNNYTWYRKYADGWVEQGGKITPTSDSLALPGSLVNLLIPMVDQNYNIYAVQCDVNDTGTNFSNNAVISRPTTTTTCNITQYASSGHQISWEVKGIAAD